MSWLSKSEVKDGGIGAYVATVIICISQDLITLTERMICCNANTA